jgi:hypothetical protein
MKAGELLDVPFEQVGEPGGRRTLTASAVPSASRARCTCATEPAASGSRSKAQKMVSGGAPRSSVNWEWICANAAGAARSCSFSNCAIHSGANRSTRVARIWPSLTKVGPRSCSAWRTRAGAAMAGAAPAPRQGSRMPRRRAKSPKP